MSEPTKLCFWCVSNDKIVATEKETGVKPKIVYDACPDCQKIFDKGITIFEASEEPIFKNQHSMLEEFPVYPSQRYWVVDEPTIRRMLLPEHVDNAIRDKRAFLNGPAFKNLLMTAKPPGATVQ